MFSLKTKKKQKQKKHDAEIVLTALSYLIYSFFLRR